MAIAAAEAPRSNGLLVAAFGSAAAIGLGLLISGYGTQAVAALIGLAVAGLVFRWPMVGFVLVIASLPLDVSGTFGETALTKLSITKMLAALTLAAAGLDFLVHRRPLNTARLLTPESLLTAALLAITALSAGLNPTAESAAEFVRQAVILLFVVVTIYFVDSPKRLTAVVTTLAVTATLIAVYSIVQRVLRPVGFSEEWVAQAGAVVDVGEENVGEMLRTTGTFSHPAWLGLFLTLCMPFTLALAWASPQARWRWLGAAAVGVQFLGVLSTYSRMAYIGAALGLGLFVYRRRFGLGVLMIGVIAAAALFPALPSDLRNRVYSIVEYRESSSSLSRLGQQIAGWHMFLEHPALGVGPGNYESTVMSYQSRVPVAFEVQAIGAHNMYIQAAAELGLAGLGLLGLVLLVSGLQLRRLREQARGRGDQPQEFIWEAAVIALWVFMVSALFVHAQYRKEWWLLVGMAAAGRTLLRRSPSKPDTRPTQPPARGASA